MPTQDTIVTTTARKLYRASLLKGIKEPFTRVSYQEKLNRGRLQLPEGLLSLSGHPIYSELSDEQKWELSRLETINFFSLNIHGERFLVRDLVDRLYQPTPLGERGAIGEYLQQFIHEENAHTFMLAGYCFRYGDGVLRDVAFQSQEEPLSANASTLLAFGRTFVLESFLDFMNQAAMKDDSLDDTASQIHRLHHIEEARHMAFDKAVLTECAGQLRHAGADDEIRQVAKALWDYGDYATRRMCSAKLYRQIGLTGVQDLAWEVLELEPRKETNRRWLSAGRRFLTSIGVTPEAPESHPSV